MIGLSNEQRAAVDTTARRAIVLAGAGSGKTRVLVARIAELIRRGADPLDILALTFTRKAGEQLRRRLHNMDIWGVWAGTMHAYAYQCLVNPHKVPWLGAPPTIYGEWESEKILRETGADLGLWDRDTKRWKIARERIQDVIDARHQRGEIVAAGTSDPYSRLVMEWVRRIRENNATTHGELLVSLRDAIAADPSSGPPHILVDEAQDLDTLQWEIIWNLDRGDGTLFMVGDVDQSIYEWRGALPGNLLSYTDDVDRFTTYRLEDNYRSVPGIVDHANHVIEHNKARAPKTMRAIREGGARVPVRLTIPMKSADLAEGFCHASFLQDTKHTVVLARMRWVLDKLARELKGRGVRAEVVGRKTAMLQTEPFAMVHAALNLTVNIWDGLSFMLIREAMGITTREYHEILQAAARNVESDFAQWRSTIPIGDASPWVKFFRSCSGRTALGIALDCLPTLFPHPMYGAVFEFMRSWLDDNHEGTIEDYLLWVAMWDVQDEIPEDSSDVLQLMTVHAAKGLEWPTVVLAGASEGVFPSKRSEQEGEIEAERRLWYVAATRAKDDLIIVPRPEGEQSRFIGEGWKNNANV
jgi:DNA helicase-2/ATP-dependent DNA helicase PcrA